MRSRSFHALTLRHLAMRPWRRRGRTMAPDHLTLLWNAKAIRKVVTKIEGFSCIRCGATYPVDIDIDSRGCPACQATAPANLQPIYARKPQVSLSSTQAGAAQESLWRFADMLPCAAEDAVSLGEGQTPLLAAERMGRFLGVPNLSIKDEGRNPTWSHKDRFSTVAVSVARVRRCRAPRTCPTRVPHAHSSACAGSLPGLAS